jgi:hypothetical protein
VEVIQAFFMLGELIVCAGFNPNVVASNNKHIERRMAFIFILAGICTSAALVVISLQCVGMPIWQQYDSPHAVLILSICGYWGHYSFDTFFIVIYRLVFTFGICLSSLYIYLEVDRISQDTIWLDPQSYVTKFNTSSVLDLYTQKGVWNIELAEWSCMVHLLHIILVSFGVSLYTWMVLGVYQHGVGI